MTPSAQRVIYPGLDTLRALASMAVVATHTSFWAGLYGQGLIGAAAQRLEIGVAIFFVLSGFLLSQPYFVAAATGGSHDSAGRYLWKRALRVLPVYWVTVVVALAVLPENEDIGVRRWIDNFLLIDIFRSENLPYGLTQMWSLSTEASFYLVLPLIMWLLVSVYRKTGGMSWGGVLGILGLASFASLLWIAVASGDLEQGSAWVRRGLPSYMTWFAAGIALAYIDNERRNDRLPTVNRFAERMAALPGVCWLLAGALFVVSSTPIAGPVGLAPATGSEAVVRHLLYVAVAVLIVVPSVFGDPTTRYARQLSHPIARHLGHLSYSLFCCHVVVLELIGDRFGFELFNSNPWLLFFATMAVSLLVSEVLYRVVEKPAMRFKNAGRRASSDTTQSTAKMPSN